MDVAVRQARLSAGVGIVFIFLLAAAGTIFVITTTPMRVEEQAPPPYAVPSTFEGYLPQSMGALDPSALHTGNLLLVLCRRPDLGHGDFILGVLIWLAPLTTILIGRLHARRWGHPQSLIIVLVGAGIAISFLPDILALLGCIVASVVAIRMIYFTQKYSHRVALLILSVFAFTGGVSSGTANRFFALYRGRAPVMFVSSANMRTLAESIGRRVAHDSNGPDEVLTEIVKLPGLDARSYPTNLYWRIECATLSCVLGGLAYLLAFAITAPESKRRLDAPMGRGYMLAWSLSLYIALGAVFALNFYAMYLCEAARQNTLWIYTRVLQGSEMDFERLHREFDRYGWSPQLEENLVRLRRLANDPGSYGLILHATLAEYWASAVIAQDRPSVSAKNGSTELTLTPSATLLDMFYFSFASFTTTGYGDIRPVNDAARVLAIVENIAELLFTAILFGIVLDWPRSRTARLPTWRRRIPRLPLLLVVIALWGCTSERLARAAPSFKGGGDPCCRVENSSTGQPIQVIVDDSKSMIGFIRADASQYRNDVQLTLDELASAGRIEVRRLSSLERPLSDHRGITEEEFYKDDQTPLVAALQTVSLAPQSPFVIISDLQQDEDNKGFEALADRLRDALDSHPYVQIVGYKLPWIARKKKEIRRPLYVVTMAPTLEDASRLQAYLRVMSRSYPGKDDTKISGAHENGPYVFRSRPFATVDDVEPEYVDGSGWQCFASDLPKPYCPRGPAVSYSALAYLQKNEPPPMHFHVETTTSMPVHNPDEISATLCEDACGGGAAELPCKPVTSLDGGPVTRVWSSVSHESAGMTEHNELSFEVEYRFPLVADRGRAHYHAEFRLGAGNLAPPWWVEQWTTVDAHNSERTLHLQGMVDTIIRAIAEKEVFLVHNIELTRQNIP